MIKTVTRHGIMLSDAMPHTYMDEITAALDAVRCKWEAGYKKQKSPEQRRADLENARKIFGIFEIDEITDFVMVHGRHENPVRTSKGYVIAIQRPPVLQGMARRDMIIQSITDSLEPHYFVHSIVTNSIAKNLYRGVPTGDKREIDLEG